MRTSRSRPAGVRRRWIAGSGSHQPVRIDHEQSKHKPTEHKPSEQVHQHGIRHQPVQRQQRQLRGRIEHSCWLRHGRSPERGTRQRVQRQWIKRQRIERQWVQRQRVQRQRDGQRWRLTSPGRPPAGI